MLGRVREAVSGYDSRMSGAIDPKKIEEWKGVAEKLRLMTLAPDSENRVNAVQGLAATVTMAQAGVLLLAEREEMLALLREVGEPGILTCDEEHDFVSAPREDCGCRSCSLACRLAAFLRGTT